MMEHLIANSGIQFVTREIEFNPQEPLIMSNGRALKYTFYEGVDFIEQVSTFEMLQYYNEQGKYIPVVELVQSEDSIVRRANGREDIDEAGMFVICPECNTSLLTTYDEADEGIININSLASFRVKKPDDEKTQVNAFDLLLDKWLPMPMYYKEVDGVTSNVPMGWCRMKMQQIGEGRKKGTFRYRLIWAFDTALGLDELSMLRPFIADTDDGKVSFAMCNKADLLLDFMSSSVEFHSFSDYIASLLGINTDEEHSCRYKAFYIYFLNFIRLSGGSPEITLHDNQNREIPVDLVLDIGNSRTCGVLFEEGQFTKGKMLELRDMSRPWIVYENKTFDMRVVFRKADFGNDIILEEPMFQWSSFVRIGDEARRLIYRSMEEDGISEQTTNYSSPKRYLWDTKPYEGQWENLKTNDDPYNVKLSKGVYVQGLSDMFDDDGSYLREAKSALDLLDLDSSERRYSRSSLMTFAFIEIFQHALSQVNSSRYRDLWGNIDCRRTIKNVIITCPTAMPVREQIILRQAAANAYETITRIMPNVTMPAIIPSADSLKITDDYADINKRVWKYDEASCCQFVYLCAELTNRYNGEMHKFFETKGHVRSDLKEEGYEGKALTIGTIDIGAGTTDVMVCSYESDGKGQSRVTPRPLFYDSFYLAGDDILRLLIQNVIIEGLSDNTSVSNEINARILAMSDAELLALPCLDNIVYRNKINEIVTIGNDSSREQEKNQLKTAFAQNLVHDFFGADSSMMSYRDRRVRNDFNTQISVPMVQFMMELLRTHRPSHLYTFDDFFPETRPSQHILDAFAHHFGFRFEELSWRYNPLEVGNVVKAAMEPLMKQLAVVLYAQRCDIIVLAGRPTSLDVITELFVKYVPVSPDRLIRLNDYRVGSWFPTADGQGYFYDQKAMVAVGAMVAYTASHSGLDGLVIDLSKMITAMKPTAYYMGLYNSQRQQVEKSLLTPEKSTATITSSVFPVFIGCKQFDSRIYQARPIYAIYNHSNRNTLNITLSRSFHDNREELTIEEVTDADSNTLPKTSIEIVQQSLVDDGKYWLDKGVFELTVK